MNILEAKQYLNGNGYILIDEKSEYDNIKDSRAELEERILKLAGDKKDKATQERAQEVINKLNTVFNPDTMEDLKNWKGWESLYKAKIKKGAEDIDDVAKEMYELTEQSGSVFISTGKTEEGLVGVVIDCVKKPVSQDEVNANLQQQVISLLKSPELIEAEKDKEYLLEKAKQLTGFLGGLVSEFLEKGLLKMPKMEPATTLKATYYTQDDKGKMSKFQASKDMKARQAAWADKAKAARWKNLEKENESYINESFLGDAFNAIKNAGKKVFTMFMFKLFGGKAQAALNDYVDAQKAYRKSIKALYAEAIDLE